MSRGRPCLTLRIHLLEPPVKDVAKDPKKYYERLVNHSQESLMVSEYVTGDGINAHYGKLLSNCPVSSVGRA